MYHHPIMKFFRWGRKKDPPPIQLSHQESKRSDAARSTHSRGTAEHGSELVRQEDQPQIVKPPQRVALAGPSSKDFFREAGDHLVSETWEERLQETIRFVFSHEQEGLLAIGTFALDQLAGVHLDRRQKLPPATDHTTSRRNSVSSVQVVLREVRSSDAETESHLSLRSPIPTCKRPKEPYPVFGDHVASPAVYCRALSGGSTKPGVLNRAAKEPPSSTNSPNPHEAGIKRGGTRELVPSTTDQHGHQSDEERFSPRVCGLFASRSRRTQEAGTVKEKRKKPPEKRKGDGDAGELKRALPDSKASLASQLGRLWRSGSASAKVTPEKKLPSPTAGRESLAQGPPCIANVEDGGARAPGAPKPSPLSQCVQKPEATDQRKRRGHSFGKGWPCAHNGKWIRTDSEFVVLEM